MLAWPHLHPSHIWFSVHQRTMLTHVRPVSCSQLAGPARVVADEIVQYVVNVVATTDLSFTPSTVSQEANNSDAAPLSTTTPHTSATTTAAADATANAHPLAADGAEDAYRDVDAAALDAAALAAAALVAAAAVDDHPPEDGAGAVDAHAVDRGVDGVAGEAGPLPQHLESLLDELFDTNDARLAGLRPMLVQRIRAQLNEQRGGGAPGPGGGPGDGDGAGGDAGRADNLRQLFQGMARRDLLEAVAGQLAAAEAQLVVAHADLESAVTESTARGGVDARIGSTAGAAEEVPPPFRDWVVRLHNDDVNTVETVTSVLSRLSMRRERAITLTRQVDKEGIATIHTGSLPSSRAVLRTLRNAGLVASMVPAIHLDAEARAVAAVSWLQETAESLKCIAPVAADALTRVRWPARSTCDASSIGSASEIASEMRPDKGARQQSESLSQMASSDGSVETSSAGRAGEAVSAKPCIVPSSMAGLDKAQMAAVRAAERILSAEAAAQCQAADTAYAGEGSQDATVSQREEERALDAEQTALGRLLRVDTLIPRPLMRSLHTLYLACIPDAGFKRAFAAAFSQLYVSLAVQYAGGVGTREDTLFGFSVQLFTTPSLVHSLLDSQLLLRIFLAFDYCLHCATASPQAFEQPTRPAWPPSRHAPLPVLDCDASVLVHRRYEFILRDLEYVLTIDGVGNHFSSSPTLLSQWLRTICRAQRADSQLRYAAAHIEHDSRAWIHAFNLHIALSAAFPSTIKPLVDLMPTLDVVGAAGAISTPLDASTPDSTRAAGAGSVASDGIPATIAAARAQAAAIGGAALIELLQWLDRQTCTSTQLPLPPQSLCLPKTTAEAPSSNDEMLSDVAAEAAVPPPSAWALPLHTAVRFIDCDVSDGVSFHLPLHRLFASLLREASFLDPSSDGQVILAPLTAALHQMHTRAADSPTNSTRSPLDVGTELDSGAILRALDFGEIEEFEALEMKQSPSGIAAAGHSSEERRRTTLVRLLERLVEHPLRVTALVAQITAGMWRRNGIVMVHQVVNYATPPLCVRLRDLDMLLLQFALATLANEQPMAQCNLPIGSQPDEAASRFLLALAHKFGIYTWILLSCQTPRKRVRATPRLHTVAHPLPCHHRHCADASAL